MENLESFVEGAEIPSLSDFVSAEASSVSPAPPHSAKHRAAKAALASGDVMKTYDDAALEMKTSTKSYTADSVFKNLTLSEKDRNSAALMDILADKTIPDDQKMAAIERVNNPASPLYEPQKVIATKSTQAYDPNEGKTNELLRSTAAELVDPLIAYQQERQQLFNTHAAQMNPASAKVLGDMVEYYFIPFANNVQTRKVFEYFSQNLKAGGGKSVGALLLPGSYRKMISDTLQAMPIDKRREVEKKLIEFTQKESGIFLSSENDFAKFDWLVSSEGGYTTTQAWLDNVTSLIDLIPLVKPIRKGIAGLRDAAKARNVERAVVVDTVQPVSMGRTVSATSPSMSRNLTATVVKGDDEVAKAVYGTSRNEALASEVHPQVGTVDNSVVSKTHDPLAVITKEIVPDKKVADVVLDTGRIDLTDSEKLQALEKVRRDFIPDNGIALHDNQSLISHTDGGNISIRGVYGTNAGGFTDAESALNEVLSTFRTAGIVPDELTLLKRVDGEYVPVNKADEVGKTGDYKVMLETEHRISPQDIDYFEELDVKRNWFDSVPLFQWGKAGSLSRTLFDISSMLHPTLTKGADVAIDQAARLDKVLLDIAGEFSDQVKTFKSERQAKVMEHLKWSNYYGVELDYNGLIGKGFTAEEIKSIQTFRRFQDNMYWLSNRSAARRLDIGGFKMFDHPNLKVFVKEVGKNQNINRVYDPAIDQVVTLSKTEMDDLYDAGGTYARTRNTITINGENVDYMIVRNQGNEIARKIRDFDQVIGYRPGYYHVGYKAPKFVIQNYVDPATGARFDRAVGVAGTQKDAEKLLNDMAAQAGVAPEAFGRVRDDVKDLYADRGDAFFDIQFQEGRTEQRYRGQPLVPFNHLIQHSSNKFVMDPIESSIRQSRTLSAHAATTEFLETAKARFMRQYEDVLNKDVTGAPIWPRSAKEITSNTSRYQSKVADARTTWEYLNYLENGYVNAIDEAYKQLLNSMASLIGYKSGPGERAARLLAELGPTTIGKTFAFQAFIATNPIRQFLLQPIQTLRLLALDFNPRTAVEMSKDINLYGTSFMIEEKNWSKEQRIIREFVDASGQVAGIDRHALVRGSMNSLRESGSILGDAASKVLSVPRKVGFDIGETINVTASLLYHRRMAMHKGLDPKKLAVRDEIYAQSRNFTYNMNAAGDMPYNQNFMGLIMQFMQVPHKAVLQVTTNRRLSRAQRVKMAAYDAVMWGSMGTVLTSWFSDILPDNPEHRAQVVDGLWAHLLNHSMKLAGAEQRIDFSSYNPYDMAGVTEVIKTFMSEGPVQSVLASPAVALWLDKTGNEGKIPKAFRRLGEWLGVQEDFGTKETALSVGRSFLEISSGMSNYFKAQYILEHGKTMGGDFSADDMAAMAQIAGFKTYNEMLAYAISKKGKEGSDALKSDAKKYYKIFRAEKLAHEEPTSGSDYAVKMVNEGMRVFRNHPEAMQEFMTLLRKDVENPEDKMVANVYKYAGFPNVSEIKEYILRMELPPEEEWKRQSILRVFDDRQQYMMEGEE